MGWNHENALASSDKFNSEKNYASCRERVTIYEDEWNISVFLKHYFSSDTMYTFHIIQFTLAQGLVSNSSNVMYTFHVIQFNLTRGLVL